MILDCHRVLCRHLTRAQRQALEDLYRGHGRDRSKEHPTMNALARRALVLLAIDERKRPAGDRFHWRLTEAGRLIAAQRIWIEVYGKNRDQRFTTTHQHYRGRLVQELMRADHAETGEPMVIYRAGDGSTWCRPAKTFDGTVMRGEEMLPRFRLLSGGGDL